MQIIHIYIRNFMAKGHGKDSCSSVTVRNKKKEEKTRGVQVRDELFKDMNYFLK